MPQLVYAFTITVPANTAKSANWSAPMEFPSATVSTIEVLVPPGPRGNVGFAIGGSGTPVIPFNAGQFIVTDNEKISWDVVDQVDSGSWEMFAYNTGTQAHSLYVRFLCDPADGASTGSTITPISSSALSG